MYNSYGHLVCRAETIMPHLYISSHCWWNCGCLLLFRNSSVQPRVPQLCQQTMDDTYAVVNKSKQLPSPASSSAPPAALHHYDNTELGTLKCPATALYSTVKPKSRCPPVNPPPAASPIYDTARPANHRLVDATLGKEQSGYEQVTGESILGRPIWGQLWFCFSHYALQRISSLLEEHCNLDLVTSVQYCETGEIV